MPSLDDLVTDGCLVASAYLEDAYAACKNGAITVINAIIRS